MEHPEHLGSIERGTMGMPPGMKLRRLGMPLCQQSTRKQPQQQQSLNSSQERYEEEEDDGAQAVTLFVLKTFYTLIPWMPL
jgi:hypothetical protein